MPSSQSGHESVATLRYHGTGDELFGLSVINWLLTTFTLGIYSFKARTRVREFHYSHTELAGDRFAYHGTASELFVGYLKAVGIFLVLGIGFNVASTVLGIQPSPEGSETSSPAEIGLVLGLWAIVGLLILVAINGARRYRFSRSSWRGIRFSFRGEYGPWMALMIKGLLLSIITLGFYRPYFSSERHAFLVENTRFGSEPFAYDGHGRDLFGPYVKALLLTIPTLGLSWNWYSAEVHRYLWGHTGMRGGRFVSTVTGRDLLVLRLTNFLLVLFTFGIATPWVMTRTLAFWCNQLSLLSTVDWATIHQDVARRVGTAAEGLADGLDLDIGLGM